MYKGRIISRWIRTSIYAYIIIKKIWSGFLLRGITPSILNMELNKLLSKLAENNEATKSVTLECNVLLSYKLFHQGMHAELKELDKHLVELETKHKKLEGLVTRNK